MCLEEETEIVSTMEVTKEMDSAINIATAVKTVKEVANLNEMKVSLKWTLQWNSKLYDIRAEYYNSCPMKSAVQIAANME